MVAVDDAGVVRLVAVFAVVVLIATVVEAAAGGEEMDLVEGGLEGDVHGGCHYWLMNVKERLLIIYGY